MLAESMDNFDSSEKNLSNNCDKQCLVFCEAVKAGIESGCIYKTKSSPFFIHCSFPYSGPTAF